MIDLSHERFFIFGCGDRPKFICTARGLRRWPTNEPVFECTARRLIVDSASYTATLETADGVEIAISEDEQGIWLQREGRTEPLMESPVALPAFRGHPHEKFLRVLHHEILVNIVDGKPLPNLFVYDKPWHRDGAMVGMVLEKTGNLGLLRDWIISLRDPFDRNNGGHEEPDNLGQVLYLISLVSDADHPLVEPVLNAAKRVSSNGHLTGLTDGREHPIYQTKWIQFGLDRLGLADTFAIPEVEDSYAPLFWWDKNSIVIPADTRYHERAELYPYLTWAEAHFWGDAPPMQLAADGYPLTWEAHASQADYSRMRTIDETFVERKMSMPHTWHGAEMFLYLYEGGTGE